MKKYILILLGFLFIHIPKITSQTPLDISLNPNGVIYDLSPLSVRELTSQTSDHPELDKGRYLFVFSSQGSSYTRTCTPTISFETQRKDSSGGNDLINDGTIGADDTGTGGITFTYDSRGNRTSRRTVPL
ncbi:hypothetical protein [Bacteroides sp. 519]|uniref:hypothetical protein n=1 Tax=Bacteroides sp. 519 TaxID=2302937 RepID=UPI0013D12BBA|nr:hypothetical protein [Bacteroides sp. 519]NDV57671.1 hypothetical protein [Bacteroides sp. 519]